MSDEHFAVSAEMTQGDWNAAATLAQAMAKRSFLIEYTKGSGYRRHFDRVTGESPAAVVDQFIDQTTNTNVQQVWQPVEWRG